MNDTKKHSFGAWRMTGASYITSTIVLFGTWIAITGIMVSQGGQWTPNLEPRPLATCATYPLSCAKEQRMDDIRRRTGNTGDQG